MAFAAVIAMSAASVFSQEEEPLHLDDLRKKADAVLNQSNVSARRDIDVVFELVDRLLGEGSKDAEHYLVRGLKHFPWDLKYQMLYAELLAKDDKAAQANTKADLVFQYGETDDLVERARKLLGKKPLPTFGKMTSLPGSNHCVVLVPLKEADRWLVVRVKERLSKVLGLPVSIQTIETEYPPFGRDRRGAILNRIRRNVQQDIDNPEIATALQRLGLSERELSDDANILRLAKHLMREAGPEEIKKFEAYLKESTGKNPQWNADQLQNVLLRAVETHRRKNIAYLGITFADIYAKDYNFLFGSANRRGGVMSYRRFTAGFNDEVPNQDRLIKRTLMQCLSSIGHIYGIDRCTNPTCARAYPNSLSEHDAKKGTLCSQCKSGFKSIFEQSPPSDAPKAAPEE